MTTASSDILTNSYESIRKGSLSFSFAAALFGKRIRDNTVKLYAWCRYIDNQVDSHDAICASETFRDRIERLRRESFIDANDKLPIPILAFREVARDTQFPLTYAQELVLGMAMDQGEVRYESKSDLLLYCYRVAGVVGLMMTYVMGIKSREALRHAVDLGIAMQLTNICRDVQEDAQLNRVYLPTPVLRNHGIDDATQFSDPLMREKIFAAVEEVLQWADSYYESGDQGLQHLPFRCRVAVAVAREIYADIGRIIRQRKHRSWENRVWVPTTRKIYLASKGIYKAVRASFKNDAKQSARTTTIEGATFYEFKN